MFESILLFIAGLLGGMLNSIAGGGTFITFPALLYVGLPPIVANATNTFSSCSGYISGTYALWHDIKVHRKQLPRIVIISFLGGVIGATLLLQTSESVFREAVPWLLLFATVLFIFGGQINSVLAKASSGHKHSAMVGRWFLLLLLLGVCVYGGFFNAGLGIIALSYLSLAGFKDINAMNGLKLLISSCVSLIAIIIFIIDDAIAWKQGVIVLIGTLIGGYIAAYVSRRIPQHYVRNGVIVASIVITFYFFNDVYHLV